MTKIKLNSGVLITFEGGEGAGKSTHCVLLRDYLKQKGYDAGFSRDPGGTPVSEAIRNIIKDPNIPKNLLTELFLFEAARAEYVASLNKA